VRRSIFGYLEGDTSRSTLRLSGDLARHEEWSEAILPADVEAMAPEGETDRRPLAVFALVVAAVLAVLAARLFILQVVDGEHNLALANGNRIRERVARAPRGLIYDRNQQVLVRNQASYDATVVPQLLPRTASERAAVYERVAQLTGKPVTEIGTKAEATCAGKDPVATGCLASPVPQLVLAGLDRDKALLLDQSAGTLPGFALDVNPIREYTDGNLLSVFLGYTGRINEAEAKAHPGYGPTDLIGKLGLERQYETVLRGENGGEQTEVDATGRPIRVLTSRDPVAGDNLVLSIDKDLQQHMVDAITHQMQASGAKRAAGVALNPKTGEVLAIASLPSYDNNMFSRGISNDDYQRLVKDPGQPLFNKPVSGAFPAGSVIKPYGASAALQEHIVTSGTTINDTGQIVVPNKYDPSKPSVYHGWERTNGLGPVNVVTAVARSSDIFFYEVMGGFTDFLHYLGVNKLADYYRKFGFGSKTGVDLPAESAGRVPTPEWKKGFSGEGWYTGDTYNISVGQGDILVSPLQMAAAVSVIANGGTLYRPHLVNQVVDDGQGVARGKAGSDAAGLC
jgi:penicillin-binding protein 2